MADLRPGDLMFGPMGGFAGVFPVGVGQVLLASRKDRLTWRQWWKIRHCGVVVENAPTGWPKVVEARPEGAREVRLTARRWTSEYVYIRPEYRMDASDWQYTQGWTVAEMARKYIGTPYNFLTYAKLAAGHFGLPLSTELLRRWISTRDDMMCSQLVDQALTDAGYHVFDDGRLPQDVVPAELFRALLYLPGQYCVPGVTGWLDNSLWLTPTR
jgi:uncharacterized protein YycO